MKDWLKRNEGLIHPLEHIAFVLLWVLVSVTMFRGFDVLTKGFEFHSEVIRDLAEDQMEIRLAIRELAQRDSIRASLADEPIRAFVQAELRSIRHSVDSATHAANVDSLKAGLQRIERAILLEPTEALTVSLLNKDVGHVTERLDRIESALKEVENRQWGWVNYVFGIAGAALVAWLGYLWGRRK